MRRRALLAALAAATAGCAGGRTDGTTTPAATTSRTARAPTATTTRTAESPTTEATTGQEPVDDGERDVEEERDGDPPYYGEADVVALETADRTLALSPVAYHSPDGGDVALSFAATATADHPARLRATLTNDRDEERDFRLRETPPFHTPALSPRERRDGHTHRDDLHLAPAAGHELAGTVPDHELADDGRWRYEGIHLDPAVPETVRLGPDESVRGEWLLLGHRKTTGWPTGIYDAGGNAGVQGGSDPAFSVAAWTTSAPGPADESRFEDASVPPLPDSDRMAWYHGADADATAYLEPGDEHPVLPAALEFTLVNHGRETLEGNPLYWKLHKLHDGEWFHVAPPYWGLPKGFVPPGRTETWRVEAYPEKTIGHRPSGRVGYLGGGRYAFEVGMSAGPETHAALVELDAPPQTVEPTRDATAERDGSRVVVTTPRHDGGEHEEPATLTVTHADSADRRLVAEQVMQPRNRGLRNALPFFESGVETVAVRTDDRTLDDVAGPDEGPVRFRFDGQAYEARWSVEESA